VIRYVFTPIVLVVLAALLTMAGPLLVPETREAELSLPGLGLDPVPSPVPGRVPGAGQAR
jgi:hypothetical protein